MNRFAELLDRLAYEPSRNNKLRILVDYFRGEADPDREKAEPYASVLVIVLDELRPLARG